MSFWQKLNWLGLIAFVLLTLCMVWATAAQRRAASRALNPPQVSDFNF